MALTLFSHTRSRRERLLRYVLRRKPCMILLAIEIVLVILLLLGCYGLIALENSILYKIEMLDRENKLFLEHKQYEDYFQCGYKKERRGFNTDGCVDGNENAFMTKTYTSTNEICIKKVEQIPCDLRLDNRLYNFTVERLKQIPQCGGMKGVNMPNFLTPRTPIYAPSINIDENLGRILRAKDFYVKCPVCIVTSRFEDKHEKNETRCVRDIRTTRYGWPEHARYCDDEQFHQEPEYCAMYKKVFTKYYGRF